MTLGVYYPTEEKREEYMNFFHEVYKDKILINTKRYILTKDRIVIRFINRYIDLCGVKLDSYVIIDGECPQNVMDEIKICMLDRSC